jgi:hypothetical protein
MRRPATQIPLLTKSFTTAITHHLVWTSTTTSASPGTRWEVTATPVPHLMSVKAVRALRAVGTVTNYSGFYFQDSHFKIHQSSSINTQQVNCSTGPPSNIPYPGNPRTPSSGSGISTDGSGYSFSVTSYNKIQVYSSDGWLVYDSLDNSPVPMDPNGNYGSQPKTSLSVSGQYCPYLPPQPCQGYFSRPPDLPKLYNWVHSSSVPHEAYANISELRFLCSLRRG